MKNSIVAGIVVFHPNMARLEECLEAVQSFVEKIYIYSNSEDFSLPREMDKIVVIGEGRNMGIGHALNEIFSAADADGYDWVVTLDQDSIMPVGIISDYEQHLSEEIGILCPQVIDKRREYMNTSSKEGITELEDTITSASCTSIAAWKTIGKFDEWLFIDLVDNEFCKRLVVNNFKILRLNRWILDQEFGNIESKSKLVTKFWLTVGRLLHSTNVAKLSYKKHVDLQRVYYTNRNIIYVNRKLSKYGPVGYQNYHCQSYLGFIFCFMLPSILRSDSFFGATNATVRGIKDGLQAKVTEVGR